MMFFLNVYEPPFSREMHSLAIGRCFFFLLLFRCTLDPRNFQRVIWRPIKRSKYIPFLEVKHVNIQVSFRWPIFSAKRMAWFSQLTVIFLPLRNKAKQGNEKIWVINLRVKNKNISCQESLSDGFTWFHIWHVVGLQKNNDKKITSVKRKEITQPTSTMPETFVIFLSTT